MNKFRAWIPLPRLLPFETFPQRLIRKWSYIAARLIGNRLGLVGARIAGVSPSGNTLLQLNKNYALGRKGTVLELPQDRVIFESVKNDGYWELEESKFLASALKKAGRQQSTKTALIDIGANTGLVTLQAMNLSNTTNEVFLFEPVPRHASAIKENLKNLKNIHINEFALSDKNGKANIFTQATNQGNTSLLKSVVPEIDMILTQIKLVETTEFCNEFLNNFEKYVIKCDTQGMDALILSRFPEWIWKNCEAAVIEVWSLTEVSKRDVDDLLAMCQEFDNISWHPRVGKKNRIELSEVSEFWLGESGDSKNLFLSRNN
jgi:FkbM family methyltransferase